MKNIIFISICFFMHNSFQIFGQEDLSKLPSYPAKLGHETYAVDNLVIKYKTTTIKIKQAQTKTIETKIGTTGMVFIGEGIIRASDEKNQIVSESITHLIIRFNPESTDRYIDMAMLEKSTAIATTELYEFYIDAFKKLYHKGNEVMIPPTDILATYSQASSGKMIWSSVGATKKMIHISGYANTVYQLKKAGKMAEAVAEGKRIAEKYPDDAEVIGAYGRVLAETQNYEEAIVYLNKAVNLKTNKRWVTAWSYAFLGKSYYQTGDSSNAKKALNRCININATRNATNFAQQMKTNYDL